MLRILGIFLVLSAVFAGIGGRDALASDNEHEIALKLFGTNDLQGGLPECRLSFWQHNKNPETDRYALLLQAAKPGDGRVEPARLKIGDDFYSLKQLVHGGEGGFGQHYVFATRDRKVKVQIEVIDYTFQDQFVQFDKVKLTVIQKGKIPFTANAKGISGCVPQKTKATLPSASLPVGVPIGPERLLADVAEVPRVLRTLMRDYAAEDCDIGGAFAWGGARYEISDGYLLWQIPCTMGAYQGSGVFGLTQNPAGAWGELLTLPNPPGLEGNQNYAAMSAEVDGRRGHIVTTELNRGTGDCGVRQTFRLIDGPGEVLEIELLEYREKFDCDGNATDPARWPVAWRAN